MHCDCGPCQDTYQPRSNRGKRHKSTVRKGYYFTEDNKYRVSLGEPFVTNDTGNSDFLSKEEDIEKLRNICLVVFKEYNHLWADIVSLAKKHHKNRKTIDQINKLQLEINKLREDLK